MNVEEFILRIKCNNNIKMIFRVSPEDTMTSLIRKIKQFYNIQYLRNIEVGNIFDDSGYEIVEDIKIGSIFKSGDVLLVTIKEVKVINNGFISSISTSKCKRSFNEIVEEQKVQSKPVQHSIKLNPIDIKVEKTPECKEVLIESNEKQVQRSAKVKINEELKENKPDSTEDVKKIKTEKQEETENDPFNVFVNFFNDYVLNN